MEWLLVLMMAAFVVYVIYTMGKKEQEVINLKREAKNNADTFNKAQKAAIDARKSAATVRMSTDPNNRDNWVQ